MTQAKRALVLSGGGARGAYAAGVLRYILEDVRDEVGPDLHFDIISGTSVGAINAAWIASAIDRPQHAVQRLWYLWRTMELPDSVQVSYRNVMTMVSRLLRETSEDSMEPKTGRSISVLDTEFFARIIHDEIDFENIQRNIDNNLLDALTVTATDVHDGRTTVFVQGERSTLPPWTRDPRRVALAGRITAEKVLASAAIPMLFPSVNVGGRWYFDGGLRQNTPLSPALRMGANKVLTVGLMTNPQKRLVKEVDADFPSPTVTFLIGKLLNALLLDPLDYDLAMLERINGLLKYGEEAAGNEDFLERLNEVIETYRGQPYRPVESLLIRPTQDLGQLAGEYAAGLSNEEWGNPVLARIGRRIANADGPREADFLSYVLFDGGYTGRLLDLGYEDARVKHKQLVRFFSEP